MQDVSEAQVVAVIHRVVDDINGQVEPKKRLEKVAETVLVGPGGSLDSLSLISLLVTLEDELEQTFGRRVRLMEDELLGLPTGPLHTLGSATSYVMNELRAER